MFRKQLSQHKGRYPFKMNWSGTMTENPTVVEQRRWFGSASGMHPTSRNLQRSIIVAAVLLIVVLVAIASYLEKWLWMRQLNYTGIFWTLLSVKWAMSCAGLLHG
jgi:hypothetical protein